jgi:uncharacterized protein with GYD domain
MPTYVILMNYTERGIREIREAPLRLEAAKASIRRAGGEIRTWFLTLGSVDVVAVAEFPSDEVLARCMLNLGSYGNVRTTTLRAFTEDEAMRIIGGLPGK